MSSMDIANLANAFLVVAQAITGFAALFFAYTAYTQTRSLHREQVQLAVKLHREQIDLAKQQAFISISEILKGLRHVAPIDPYWPDVVQSANALELLAIVWSEEIVTREIVERTYARLFMTIFEEIYSASDPKSGIRRGEDILAHYTAEVLPVYRTFAEKLNRADITRGQRFSNLSDGSVSQ